MNDIEVEFSWTAEDLISGRRWHWRSNCRPSIRLAAHLGATLLIAICIFLILEKGLTAMPIAGIFGSLYFYVLRKPFTRYWTRREFSKRNDSGLMISYHFANGRILVNTEQGHSDSSWKAISKVLQTPEGFLLYPTSEIFYFIPNRGFRDPDDLARFAELPAANGVPFTRIGSSFA